MRIRMTASLAMIAIAFAAAAAPAIAQDDPAPPRVHRRAPLRIEIAPSQRLYRQCVDRYVIEQRYSGPTIVPRTSCRWALR